MTVYELLTTAAALFFETDLSAYQEVALPLANMVTDECFEANNRLRRAAGKKPLPQPPRLTDLQETIPYEENLLRLVMPYGLAAKLIYDEQDSVRLNYFVNEYNQRLDRCDRWVVAF